MRPWALVLVLLLLSSHGWADGDDTRAEVQQKVKSTHQSLKQASRKFNQAQLKLKQDERVKKNAEVQIEAHNREVEAALRDAQVNARNLALVEDKLTAVNERSAAFRVQEAADREALRVQLRAVQRSRSRQGPALLFSARTPAEWAARAGALRELSLGTRRRVLDLRSDIDTLESYRSQADQKKLEILRRRGETDASRRAALQKKSQAQALLNAVSRRKILDQHTADERKAELEAVAGRLQSLMDDLQQASQREAELETARARQETNSSGSHRVAQTSSGPSTVHGRVPWPVTGKLLSLFGKHRHPVFNVNVFNRGIEIAAPFGTPIKAIAAGKVEHVGELQSFGQLIVIDHGGGLKSVYGYASQALVQLGQRVVQGDTIAEVGQHGAEGQPALYFQISQNAHPQDPLRYLTRR
jgi:murein hydrolase activator